MTDWDRMNKELTTIHDSIWRASDSLEHWAKILREPNRKDKHDTLEWSEVAKLLVRCRKKIQKFKK